MRVKVTGAAAELGGRTPDPRVRSCAFAAMIHPAR
jgi:hypothetical protein